MVANVDFGSYDYQIIVTPDELVLHESTGHFDINPTITFTEFVPPIGLPRNEVAVDIRFRTSGGTLTLRSILVYYDPS